MLLRYATLFAVSLASFLSFRAHDWSVGPRALPYVVDTCYNFGESIAGDSITHDYIIGNSGTEDLAILKLVPSCGCTVATLKDSILKPGDLRPIHVVIDTRGKLAGEIVKTIVVRTNSEAEPELTLRIRGTIKLGPNLHQMTMHREGIFKGNCATCHVEKGVGLLSAALFLQDCAICHGLKANGKPAPALHSKTILNHSESEWSSIISGGLPNTNMPAFSSKFGGPLGEKEISSLVQYLKEVKASTVQPED